MNVEFANPKCLLLLLLIIPLLAWYIFKLRKVQASFKLSSTSAFAHTPKTFRVYMRHLPFLLRLLSIALIIIVVARPQAVNSTTSSESEGIDIMIALDLSGTMQAQDFQPNRLEAAKKVASEFISDRENDRIGLVTFAGESFTQCPLTTDRGVLLNLLNEVKYGMINDGTAIGLGLANCVNRLKDSPSKSKVVILLTDGSNNTGQITPMTAAGLAHTFGIRVYTIGVGSKGMAPCPDPNGMMTTIPVDLDENMLTNIATTTGGEYFRATDNKSLKKIYAQIDTLEKSHIKENKITRRNELYLPFLLFAMGLILLELILRRTWLRSIP